MTETFTALVVERDELASLVWHVQNRRQQLEKDLALTAEIATRNRDEAHAVSDVQEVLARVYAFKHFRDLSPDKGYTSPEVEDCFTLADEVERLKARLAEAERLLIDVHPWIDRRTMPVLMEQSRDVILARLNAVIDAARAGGEQT